MKTIQSVIVATCLALALTAETPARASDEAWFSQAELDQMLAPIALYPDTVLSHVLIAATYPLEVIQAARWSRANPGLTGQDAVAAVEYMNWDPSVMALAAFPELLRRLDEDIEWTHRLGDAFLVQEEQVVGTIQNLRDRAYAHGHLRSNDHVRVVRQQQTIYIEPARTRVVYVPYYDPHVVYGKWRWSSYPPVYWRHPPRYVSGVSFYWGPAYRIAPTFYFSSFHWSRRQVVVVKHHHHHYYQGRRASAWRFHSGRDVARYKDAHRWQHDPQHRRGVSYRHRIDERHRARQSQSSARRVAGSQQQISSRSSQRSWASDRRESLSFSGRSTARSTRQASQSPARSAQPRTAAGSVRDRLQRSRSAPPSRLSSQSSSRSQSRSSSQSSTQGVRQQQRSRAAARPATARSAQSRVATRPAVRSGSKRPDSSARARVRNQRERASLSARAPSRSAARSVTRSSPSPRSAPARSTAQARSAPQRSLQRSQAPKRSAERASAPRTNGAARSAPRNAAPRRSAAPSRQSGSSPQRARSAATPSRERSRSRSRGN